MIIAELIAIFATLGMIYFFFSVIQALCKEVIELEKRITRHENEVQAPVNKIKELDDRVKKLEGLDG